MFQKFDRWLTAKGFLSKTAFVLLGLGILLAFISFVKGIQVLMFIPAFVLALFFYSFFDIHSARRKIGVTWINEKKLELRINFLKPHTFCTYFLAFEDAGGITFLVPRQNLTFVAPAGRGRFFLLVQGRLDIFRAVIPLPEPPDANQTTKTGDGEEGEIYFSLKEFEDGDELKRIDPLQTAKRQKWYIRKIVYEAPMRRPGRKVLPELISLQSNQRLIPKSDVTQGRLMEWSIVVIAVLAAYFEWRNLIFTSVALGSMGFLFLWLQILQWKKPGKGWMNTTALLLFVGCFIEGAVINDTVPAGTHFLILLAIWKHLFQRERRDAFTYVFLILFVFVALSLYTLSAWFIILFFLFLVQSVVLLSIYSAGERETEYKRVFESPAPPRARLLIGLIVLVTTIPLFFLLPHGNRHKDVSLLEQKEVTRTGFDQEVGLNNILSIKQDFAKKIVIENADMTRIDEYQQLYWRGMRYDSFLDMKWKASESTAKLFLNPSRSTIKDDTETWNVRYYYDGDDTLFLPYSPVRIDGGRHLFMTHGQDLSLMKFAAPQYTDVVVGLVFKKAVDGENVPAADVSIPVLVSPIDPSIIQLMTPFWNSIPAGIEDDPARLADFIRNEAGFSYSLQDTAPDLNSFLYEKKKGHCEYFASVLALTLQHFGHRTTFVNGYQGGEWNESAGKWIIRGTNAHSWVEVLDDTAGWTRLDPTPSSAETFFPGLSSGWSQKFFELYDTLELKWFEYFVSFTGERQKQFFRGLFHHRRAIFWSLVGYFLLRKIIPPARRLISTTLTRTPVERFLWWLKQKTQPDDFVLNPLENRFPKMVSKTRQLIFGKDPQPKELLNLKKEWKKVLKTKWDGG